VDSVSQILFSLYNGTLYRILVIYDQRATDGLTAGDMRGKADALEVA